MRRYGLCFGLILICLPAAAQFSYGEVIVSGHRETGEVVVSTVRMHTRDGTFARELARSETVRYAEPLVHDQIVLVGTIGDTRIIRIRSTGAMLTPFTSEVPNARYLSPGPYGGVLADNTSGEIFQFAPEGTLLRHRDVTEQPPAAGGIDLAADGCTVFYAVDGELARWNACRDTPAEFVTSNSGYAASYALRILRDGTFLLSVLGDNGRRTLHLNSAGGVLREYDVAGSDALAVDIDGTSFWTNAGNYLVRVDIATGAVLSTTYTDSLIDGITVVGEPRAGHAAGHDVAVNSPMTLVTIAASILLLAAIRLR
ncbi:MAG TPA: hypothetical protein VEK11_24780 [Thermoanaerobaculia bacterium]|nr:hypothetical protein [Thermoanaerobaculia bacterium]